MSITHRWNATSDSQLSPPGVRYSSGAVHVLPPAGVGTQQRLESFLTLTTAVEKPHSHRVIILPISSCHWSAFACIAFAQYKVRDTAFRTPISKSRQICKGRGTSFGSTPSAGWLWVSRRPDGSAKRSHNPASASKYSRTNQTESNDS